MLIGKSSTKNSGGAYLYNFKCDTCRKKFLGRKRAIHHQKHYCSTCRKLAKEFHNRKYDSKFTDISCHICHKEFSVYTSWYQRRLLKGKNRFACSRKCSNKLQSITIKEIRSTDESRAKTVRQLNRRWSDPAERRRYGQIMKSKPWSWHQRRLSHTLKTCLKSPTKPERTLIALIKQHKLPFRYTGDGKIWIGKLNPDFISTDGSRRILDLHGCYWHGCQRCFPGSKGKGIPYNQRISTYVKHGWGPIIVWEHDLKDPEQVIFDLLHKSVIITAENKI